jgi:tetratricopeptide (TPR) repeat protein
VIPSIIPEMADKASIIKEAQKCLARGQIDKAIAEWEKLTKEYPDGNAFNTIGDLYLKKGSKTNAIDSYHQAANLFKQEGFALKALALYKKILNINAEDDGALFALGELNEAKGLVTDAIKFYLAAADSLSKAGSKEKLLTIYEKILALSPENIPLRIKLAELYTNSGLMPEAIKQYSHIARLNTESGDTGKAIEYYQKILGLEPHNRQAFLDLSFVYEKTGNLDKAFTQIKEAVSLLPQETELLLRAAEIQGTLSKYSEAREYLSRVTAIEPANLRAQKMLADLYLKEGNRQKAWEEYLPVLDDILLEENHDDAVNLLESFREVDPVETGKRLVTLFMQTGDNQQLIHQLNSLGDIFMKNGKQREALNYYREAFKLIPDDDLLKNKVIELEKALGKEHIVVEAEKTTEEALMEADIYIRYGLFDKAGEILEEFRQKEPDNIDLHLKLKMLYTETGDKERAVAECLILHQLYENTGDVRSSGEMIRDALAVNPEDPRLAGMSSLAVGEETETEAVPQELSIEDYREEISDADFYARQGLTKEAREIFERLKSLFPENTEISQKLTALEQVDEEAETEEDGIVAQGELQEAPVAESGTLESENVPEPSPEGNVMDIFNEFKKGLEKEIEAEDYETHYNLGIAYKEMGLIDDAIREFQSSRNDPKRFAHSSNMLGICYIEKGLYPLAIDVLKSSLAMMKERDESYWTMQYDLAMAYEKNSNIDEALDSYLQVYGWNAQFRDIAQKVDTLKEAVRETSDQEKLKERKDRVSYL